ncbi:hypothetical protein EV586_104293 [Tumebacillus sp. BK434]|uniref:hypothetical protein n=1 Tax=Tumebacillus sp. BK434 TaxID=2512169 RepID=UPI00104D7900|nr:hypothetical protein [Tumebacillus sp. BK434]TCP54672.1 hypothetical protein EV586_104293 [Tumebacillus sp. BK434]
MAMFVVLMLLFLIASFGISFIMDMFTKKFPWTSTVVAVALVGYYLVSRSFDVGGGEILLCVGVIGGALAASLTIRTLVTRGFKMFGA